MGNPVHEAWSFATGCDADLLAATSRGLFRSRDDGHSWALVGLSAQPVRLVAARTCRELFAVVGDKDPFTSSVL